MTKSNKGRDWRDSSAAPSTSEFVDSTRLIVDPVLDARVEAEFIFLEMKRVRTCGECRREFRKGQTARHLRLYRLEDGAAGLVASLLCVDCWRKYRAGGIEALPALMRYADECCATHYGQVGGMQ